MPAVQGGSVYHGHSMCGSLYHGSVYHGSVYRGHSICGSLYHGSVYRGSVYHGFVYHSHRVRGSVYHGSVYYGHSVCGSGYHGSLYHGCVYGWTHLGSGVLLCPAHQEVQADVGGHRRVPELDVEDVTAGLGVWERDVHDAVQTARSHQRLGTERRGLGPPQGL